MMKLGEDYRKKTHLMDHPARTQKLEDDDHHPHKSQKLQMLPFGPALPAAIVLVVENHRALLKDCLVPRSPGSPPVSSSSSSSIGTCCDDLDNEGEVQSSLRSGPLERMETLESSLPLKRGLSQFFDGKSRSFTSLKEVSSAEELAKPESPFNLKRRRLSQSRRIPSSKSSSNFKVVRNKDWSPPRPAIVTFLPRSFSLSDVQRNHHHHQQIIPGVQNAA